MISSLFIYLLVGAVAGVLSGLLGIGGGIIIVPTLAFLFVHSVPAVPSELAMHFAVGCSLASMIFTSTSSAFAHHKQGSLIWRACRRWLFGLAVGAICGVFLAHFLSTDRLMLLFGCFLLLMALKIFLYRTQKASKPLPNCWLMNLVGVVFGIISSMLGVGGGVMMVPFLTRYGLTMAEAAGTASACVVLLAFVATVTLIIAGHGAAQDIAWATGYVYWPSVLLLVPTSMACAPIGSKLAHRLPMKVTKNIFAVFMVIVAIKMIL